MAAASAVAHDDPFGLHLELGGHAGIAAALAEIEQEANNGFAGLREGNGEQRDAVIARVAPILSARIASLLSTLPDDGTHDQHLFANQGAVERASAPVWKIAHWIQARQSNSRIKPMFARLVVDPLDRVRMILGLPSVRDMPSPLDYPDGEVAEAEDENDELGAAVSDVRTLLASRLEFYRAGIDMFKGVAVLERAPPQPSLWWGILKGAATALLGNVVGAVVGAGSGRDLKVGPDGRVPGDARSGFLAGLTSDVIQSTLAAVFSHDFTSAQGRNGPARDRLALTQLLVMSHVKLQEMIEMAMNQLVAKRSMPASMFRAVADSLQAQNDDLTGATFRATALVYAQLQARKTVAPSAESSPGTEGDEERYLRTSEVPGIPGNEPMEARHQRGGTGVGRVKAKLRDVGGRTIIKIDRFEIHGMTSDMAMAVLTEAGHRLSALNLPLEISIDPFKLGFMLPHPLLVVDQRGTLREAIDWNSIERSKPLPDGMPPSEGADAYASPASFWKAVRDLDLPEGTARMDAKD
jgi:hypothetical protein